MHITILALGSRGDVQPYVALGLGLQKAGHQVRLAAFTDFEAFVQENGLEFFPIAGINRAMVQSEQGQAFLASNDNFIRGMRQLASILESFPDEFWSGLWESCQGAEAILYSSGAPHGYHIAEKLGIPSYPAYYFPFLGRTRAFPHPLWPLDMRLGGAYNLMTHAIAEQFMWQPFRRAMNRWRQERLKLPPVPPGGPYGRIQRRPMLYGYSAAVVPRPPDWGDWIHVTGFWFLDGPRNWQPPADLAAFLESGPPPVYVGFGSMAGADPEETTALIVNALSASEQRGVLLAAPGRPSGTDLPEGVFTIESAPFDWLFPRMAAVVHHGGAGTTGTGIRAGVPSIIVPFCSDQPFWGKRVAGLGVGPQPIPRTQLSAERLAAALRAAAGDAGMRARAADLGRRIGSEDGVTRAVEVLHRELSVGPSSK